MRVPFIAASLSFPRNDGLSDVLVVVWPGAEIPVCTGMTEGGAGMTDRVYGHDRWLYGNDGGVYGHDRWFMTRAASTSE